MESIKHEKQKRKKLKQIQAGGANINNGLANLICPSYAGC